MEAGSVPLPVPGEYIKLHIQYNFDPTLLSVSLVVCYEACCVTYALSVELAARPRQDQRVT